MVEQMALPCQLVDSLAAEQAPSNPVEAMPAILHIHNHPSTSPTVAICAKLPYGPRANSVSAELISPSSTSSPAPETSGSDGSCGTQLCVDPSRSVTPESLPQPRGDSNDTDAVFTRYNNKNGGVPLLSPVGKTSATTTSTTNFNSHRSTACPTGAWRRVQHFIKVTTQSPLVASALAALDVAGHPTIGDQLTATAGNDNLRWTLSAMLALFLRSNAPTVSEESLLAMLWTMESWSDARRSPVTLVLGDYLKHMAAFDPARAASMSATWQLSFCALRSAVVESQIELLQNLEWNVRLSDGAILHCHRLLFGALPCAQNNESSTAAVAVAAAAAAAEAEAWSAAAAAAAAAASKRTISARSWRDPSGACADQVNALCACVLAQSSRIAAAVVRQASVAAAVFAAQSKKRAAVDAASPTFCTHSSNEGSIYEKSTTHKRLRRGGVVAERIFSLRSSQ
jgi:hypothetical protein